MPNNPTPVSARNPLSLDLGTHAPRWAMIGIFWILALGSLTISQAFFIPVLTAILLTLIFSPVRRYLSSHGISSSVSAALILGFITVLSAVGIYFLSGTVHTRMQELPRLIPNAIEKIETITGVIEPVIEAKDQIDEMAASSSKPETVVIRERGLFSAVAEITPRIVGQIAFSLALMALLISSGDMFYEKLVRIMPTIRDKRRAIELVKSIEERVSSYFLTITVINAGLGISIGLALWLLGMPDPVLFGIAAFILNFIPFVGAIVGVTITFMIALLGFDSILAATIPALAYFSLTSMEGQFVTPVLVGKRLRLNAVVVFIAVAFGALLWSVMGMFLAIPILIVVKALSEEVECLAGIGEFLGERTSTSRRDQKILDKAL